MKIKLDVSGFVAMGAFMAMETYAIGELVKRYVEQCARASRAEKKHSDSKRELSLLLRENRRLREELESYR